MWVSVQFSRPPARGSRSCPQRRYTCTQSSAGRINSFSHMGSVIPRLRRPRVCKHGAAFCKDDVHTCFFLLCKHELPQVLPVKYAFTQLPSCLRSISQGADLVHFRSPHVCKHNMSYLTFASRAARVCKQDTCVCKPKAHILSGVCKHKVARGYVSHLAFANAMCESI